MATLRPDIPMYETDGNLEPIRHPEAQHMLAAMDEHRRQQEKLMALWAAADAYKRAYLGVDYWPVVRTHQDLFDAIAALGPPPDKP